MSIFSWDYSTWRMRCWMSQTRPKHIRILIGCTKWFPIMVHWHTWSGSYKILNCTAIWFKIITFCDEKQSQSPDIPYPPLNVRSASVATCGFNNFYMYHCSPRWLTTLNHKLLQVHHTHIPPTRRSSHVRLYTQCSQTIHNLLWVIIMYELVSVLYVGTHQEWFATEVYH